MTRRDPKDIVRSGYDALSMHYSEAFAPERYAPWIEELLAELAPGSAVADVGCGSGVPFAWALADAGHRVTGVDISSVQIRRARENVPEGEFHRGDVTTMDFPPGSFAAVVCLYVLIHIPLAEQPALLRAMAGWLALGGALVAVTGHQAFRGIDENWLNGGAAMWWEHADAATYRAWIAAAGLEIEREEFVPEGDGGHVLFWARHP